MIELNDVLIGVILLVIHFVFETNFPIVSFEFWFLWWIKSQPNKIYNEHNDHHEACGNNGDILVDIDNHWYHKQINQFTLFIFQLLNNLVSIDNNQ